MAVKAIRWFQGFAPILLLVVPIVLLRATAAHHPKPAAQSKTASPAQQSWWQNCQRQQVEVQAGDYLIKIFKRQHLDTRDAYALLKLNSFVKQTLTKVPPGLVLDVCRQGPLLKTLAVPVDQEHLLLLSKDQNTWRHWLSPIKPKQQNTFIKHFTLSHSFYREAKKVGLSAYTIKQIEHILRDKINFRKDLRPGDHFDVILRQAANQKHPVIVAVKYNHRGRTIAVMRYRNRLGKIGYYTQKGHSVLRSFDRYPVHFKRISSKFRLRRSHPILGYVRPHYGVDLAAPSGTPIYATSSGKVNFVGRKHGYGNTVVIRHGQHYKTIYAHMSKFAKHLHSGSYVKRHQLIGYVGMTGLATGPHCHYEFRINNRPQDPLRVRLPGSPALTGQDKRAFAQQWYEVRQQLVMA